MQREMQRVSRIREGFDPATPGLKSDQTEQSLYVKKSEIEPQIKVTFEKTHS